MEEKPCDGGSTSCAYCGVTGSALTRDHIPPRCVFPTPSPDDMLTVPCCERCRRDWPKDDEYFRDIVHSTRNLEGHPDAVSVQSKIERSLANPQKRAYALSLANSFRDVDVFSAGGIYLGREAGLEYDQERIRRVMGRIVGGLFYNERRNPIPQGSLVKTTLHQSLEPVERLIRSIQGWSPYRTYARKLFGYSYVATVENPDATLWVCGLYDCLGIVGFVRPEGAP